MTQTGDRVTRYLYDKDNRKVGSRGRARLPHRVQVRCGRTADRDGALQPAQPRGGEHDRARLDRRHQSERGRPVSRSNIACRHTMRMATRSPSVWSARRPSWLSFDAGTATLRGTPPATVTSDSVTLRADDGRGKTSDVTVLIAVTNAAPSARAGRRRAHLGVAVASGRRREHTGELRRAGGHRPIAHL